jgi:hypothetical protein
MLLQPIQQRAAVYNRAAAIASAVFMACISPAMYGQSNVFVQPASGTGNGAVGLVVEASGGTPSADVFQVQNSSGTPLVASRWVSGMPSNALGLYVNGVAAFGGTGLDPNTILTVNSNVNDPQASAFGAQLVRNVVVGTSNAQNVYGGSFQVSTSNNSFNLTGSMTGGLFQVENSNTAVLSSATGGQFIDYNVGPGKIVNGYGGYFATQNLNAMGTITNAYDLYVAPGFNLGSITNEYGLYIAAPNSSGTLLNKYALITEANAGNVGIGTAAPQYPLSVNGTIQAKEVIVNSGWSDYVFDADHRISPLSEVATYIAEHHHLPEIPSAAEVAEKGVSLGDMQAKLLAKIEELTLHMIEVEKENQALRERVARLEAK